MTWLAQTTAASPVKPVVIYNHPSRKDASSMQNVDDIVSWRKVNDLVIGFESGVGHQGSCHSVRTIRRFLWSIAGTRLPLELVTRGTHCFNAT